MSETVVDPTFILALISMAYIGTAVYIRTVYPWMHYSSTGGFLSMGTALFLLANTTVFFGHVGRGVGSAIILGLFVLTLVFAVWSIRLQVAYVDRLRDPEE